MSVTRENCPHVHRRSVAFSRGDTVDLPHFSPPCGMAAHYGGFWSNYTTWKDPNNKGRFFNQYREGER